MDREAGRVDEVIRFLKNIPFEVYFHQARRRDFLEQQAVGIDEEMFLRPRHPGGDVRVDQIVPAVKRHQPVEGGEVHADRPFLVRNRIAHGRAHCFGDGHEGTSFSLPLRRTLKPGAPHSGQPGASLVLPS